MNQDNMHIVFLCPKSTSSPVNFWTALNLAANSDDWLTQATSCRLNIFELLVWFPFTKHRNKPRSKMPPGPRVSKHQADHSNVEGNVHDDGDRHAQQRLLILLHSRLWPARNALWKWTVEFDLLEIFAAWALSSSTLDDILFLSRCLLWCRHVQNWGIFRRIPEIGAAILGQGSYGVVSWPRGSCLIGMAYTSTIRRVKCYTGCLCCFKFGPISRWRLSKVWANPNDCLIGSIAVKARDAEPMVSHINKFWEVLLVKTLMNVWMPSCRIAQATAENIAWSFLTKTWPTHEMNLYRFGVQWTKATTNSTLWRIFARPVSGERPPSPGYCGRLVWVFEFLFCSEI